MLEFSAPIWLGVPAAVGVLGVWALWRGQRRVRAVPSLRLWRGLEGAGGEGRRRVVDPLWVMVLAAGILAGLGLAGPRWVSGAAPGPGLAVEWSVRSVPSGETGGETGGETEAWVRCSEAEGDGELVINGKAREVGAAELRQGLALGVVPDAAGRVGLELRAAGRRAAARFERAADVPAFGLIEVVGPGLAMDGALRRVFAVQRGARVGDPSVRPRVMLVNDPRVTAEDLAGADLVVGLGAMPGVTVGERIEAAGSGWVPEVAGASGFEWPSFVVLKEVHVRAMRAATLTAEWHVIATAGGRPWMAWREVGGAEAGGKAAWFWLGSEPGTETDWPREAGFVVFFGEMQQRALGGARAGYVEWVATPQTPGTSVPAIVGLGRTLGIAGMALLAGAVVWFVGRAR